MTVNDLYNQKFVAKQAETAQMIQKAKQVITELEVSQAERVYGLFTVKEPFELILSNKEITRKISGIVQQVTPGSFTANDTFRIILYCGNPFFTDMENSVVSNLAYESGFEFELELLEPPALEFGRVRESLLSNLYNNGNIATGFTATFTTEHPCSGVGILNARTREYLRSTKPLLPYERIVFDTRTGQKTMYHYDVNNNETNILNTMQLGSTFFQLATGENPVLLQLQDGYTDHLSVVYEWDDYYAGI